METRTSTYKQARGVGQMAQKENVIDVEDDVDSDYLNAYCKLESIYKRIKVRRTSVQSIVKAYESYAEWMFSKEMVPKSLTLWAKDKSDFQASMSALEDLDDELATKYNVPT